MANSKQPNQPYKHSFANVPVWNKLLLLLAILSMLTGAGLWAARGIGDSQSRPASSESRIGTMGAGAGSLVDPRTGKPLSGSGGGQQEIAADDWSPALFKLGGSFLVGFCVGYAMRTFLRITIFALGLVFLAMFALGYYAKEPIINWSAVSGLMEQLLAKAQSELGGFKTFIEGSLPSAGLAALGLYSGFKKH
jgi:uncharacterized membrane protein (Fun14 family)